MMHVWNILRCNDCHKIIGIQEIIDCRGTMEYCRECGFKRIDAEGIDDLRIGDWKYGVGTLDIKKEYANDKDYY